MYNKIANPMTNRNCSIYSKKGRYILQQYLNHLYGGASADENAGSDNTNNYPVAVGGSTAGKHGAKKANRAPTAEQIIEAQSKVVWEAAFAGTLTEEVLRKNESADLDWVNHVGHDGWGAGWASCHAAVNGESPFKMLRLLIIHGADSAASSEGDDDYGMTTEEMAREAGDDASIALCQYAEGGDGAIKPYERLGEDDDRGVSDGNGAGEEAWALRVVIPYWIREQDEDYEEDLIAGKYYEDGDGGLHLTHKVLKKDIQPTHPEKIHQSVAAKE